MLHQTEADIVDALTDRELRRRRSFGEKLAMVPENCEPGRMVWMVVRECGLIPNQLFGMRKLCQTCELWAMSAGEELMLAVAVCCGALKQIQDLLRMPGKKTMEAEILREAMEYGCSPKWVARLSLLPGDD